MMHSKLSYISQKWGHYFHPGNVLSAKHWRFGHSALLLCAVTHFNALASSPIPSSLDEQQQKSVDNKRILKVSKQVEVNSDDHIIEIGFFYTADLLQQLGRAKIDDYIDEQISAANQVMSNSGVAIRRQVSYVGQFPMANEPKTPINSFLSHVFSGSVSSHLSNIRERFGLDYLTILRPQSDLNFCGWAYYDSPYAIMEVGGNCTSATLGAHEWGHNDGADHDIVNSSDTPIRADARGYNCAGEGTIMSTSNTWNNRHNIYSSPDLSVNGQVCGKKDEADFVRVLKELVTLPNHLGNKQAASEKLASVAISTDKTTIEEGESIEVTLTLVDKDNNTTTLDREVSVELHTHANASSDGSAGAVAGSDFVDATQRITFLAGESTKSITVKTIKDNEQEPTEVLNIAARYGDHLYGSDNDMAINITNAVGQENLSFAVASAELKSEQSMTVAVNRAASLDKAVTVAIVTDSERLSISPKLIEFSSANGSESITITAASINASETATVRLEAEDGSSVYDQLTIKLLPQVTKPEASPSSGGSLNYVLVLLAALALRVRRR